MIYGVLWSAGERPAPSVVPLSEGTNFDEVVFFARSEGDQTPEGPHMVCLAVAQLIGGYVMNPDALSLDMPNGYYYNYVYSDPDDALDRFYSGKGVGKRWREHYDQAVGQTINEGEQATLETAKLARIAQYLEVNPVLRAEDLCKIVAVFSGPYAESQAFAVEQYLIQRECGVFNLTNLNNGQGKHGAIEWQSRPRSFDQNAQAMVFWRDLLGRALNEESEIFTAHDRASLILHQLPSDLVNTLQIELQNHVERPHALEWLGLSISPEGDLSVEANVTGAPVCLQLRFGRKNLECRINLRPGPRDAACEIRPQSFPSFMEYIGRIWPDAAIRNRDTHPFVKPYSVNQRGQADVDFSVADLTAASLVHSCLVTAESARLNLPEAMAKLIELLQPEMG